LLARIMSCLNALGRHFRCADHVANKFDGFGGKISNKFGGLAYRAPRPCLGHQTLRWPGLLTL